MELVKNLANLSKTLSEKFSLREGEASLYLLALIQRNSRRFASHSAAFAANRNRLVDEGVLNWQTLRAIENSGLIDFQYFNKFEYRQCFEYLAAEYLKSAKISPPSPELVSRIVEIATEVTLELHPRNESVPHFFTPYISRNPNYRTDKWCIYAANVGTGDVVVKLLKNLEREKIDECCCIVGQEPDEILNFLTDFNYFAHNIGKNLQTTSRDNPLTSSNRGLAANAEIGLKDELQIAVSIPPFTAINQHDLKDLYKFLGSTETIYFSELAYIELMLKRVSERGKVIALVRTDFLASKKSRAFREKYLKNDWIEKITAFPKELANYSFDVSVIVFNKAKTENKKGFIIFDGSEAKFERTRISINEVFSNNSDLRASRYATKESKELRNILAQSQYEVRRIRDLIDFSVSGENYSPRDMNLKNGSKDYLPFVRVADLAKDVSNFELDISKVERRLSRETARNVIDFPAVLVSKITPKLNPTYFNFTEQPIVIGSDVIALKLKEDTSVEYFLTQLHSKLVQIQVEMLSSGTIVNRISKEDFLNIQIILPPLEEQPLQILEMRGLIEEKIAQELQVTEAKKADDKLISSVAHSFKNKLSPIIMDYAALLDFLKEADEKHKPINLNTLARPVSENETVEDVDTFEKIANRLYLQLKDLPKLFNDFQIFQKESVNKSPVNLNDYFKEIEKQYSGQDYQIKIESKNRSIIVEIDKEIFSRYVIENLVDNAKEHGFKDSVGSHQIIFELSKIEDKYARILYKDNGVGFQSNYTFENYKTFGSKSVYSNGTGIGGFSIHKIIELHKGEVRMLKIEDEFESFKTQFEILLPLY